MKPGRITAFFIVSISGLLPAIILQFFIDEPVSRSIHVRNFRYGKDPSVIRCNRGDTLHITFSSDDTGHSFFLEEFNVDAKVTPLKDEIEIFRADDPTSAPEIRKELVLIARHDGFQNLVISRSNYRCHVWCGPMHAFESGKLIILPNTLLVFSLGALAGIVLVWFLRLRSVELPVSKPRSIDIFRNYPFIEKAVVSRWPQIIITVIALLLIYVVIMTTIFGTKVSGRNLGVMLMWAVWLFMLVSVITPLGGRLWCTVCPLPVFGDFLQRRSFFTPEPGKTGQFNNRFSGMFLKWPAKLGNSWPRLIVFLVLATFSTTLVASPRVSGFAVLILIILPTVMAVIWELRAFCRYMCPISVFITPFAELSPVGLRTLSDETCSNCRAKFCANGNSSGWSCPYGLNAGEVKINAECGLCLECTRSCTYGNVTLVSQPFGQHTPSKGLSEAWLAVAIFTTSIIYSFLYLGHWPELRDYVNILDKDNWNLFAAWSAGFWLLILIFMPALIYLLAISAKKISGIVNSAKDIFLNFSGMILPLGLSIWISFVIPMLFVNVTFIAQSLSDPFGWGWDFFGTANIPWNQFLPQYIPWFQSILLLGGFHVSIRNMVRFSHSLELSRRKRTLFVIPFTVFLVVVAAGMILFFTN